LKIGNKLKICDNNYQIPKKDALDFYGSFTQSENTLSIDAGFQNRKNNRRKMVLKLKERKQQQKIVLKQRRKLRWNHQAEKLNRQIKQKILRKARRILKLMKVKYLARRKKNVFLGIVFEENQKIIFDLFFG